MVARLLHGLHTLRALAVAVLLLVVAAPVVSASELTPGTPEATGWRFAGMTVEPSNPAVGDVATVRFSVVDDVGTPLTGLRPVAALRPAATTSGARPDPVLIAVGRPLDDPGWYQVSLALNQAGRWWIDLEVTNDAGRTATTSHFVVVAPTLGTPPATTEAPLFLPGDSWGAYYRLDPDTGSLATLSGEDLLHAGNHWWLATTRLTPRGPVTPEYGGTWHLTVELSDGLSGRPLYAVDLGDIRASVYVGSADEPAISTSLAVAPDGSHLYLYWARQLGQGWLASVAIADAGTGEILLQRELTGAVVADVFWGRLDVSADGTRLVLAERTARSASQSGYRLTVLDAATLDTVAQHRRTVAPDDPLTACVLPYPGPAGAIPGADLLHYSLCMPRGSLSQPALVIWDPIAGAVVHQVSLAAVAGDAPQYVDGVAAPDGRHFYAVNTATRHVAEIDLLDGNLLRTANLAPDPGDPPSTFDRFFDWIFGWVAPQAAAGVLIEPGVTIAPDGSSLYLVPASSGSNPGDGVLVIDTDSLQVVGHLLAGQPVAGVLVTPTGHLVVREVGNADHDALSVLDPDGEMLLSLTLPGRGIRLGQGH